MPGWLVHAVVGATDPLGQPACPFRRADMDDQIDIAPVDAEIERRGGNNGAQPVVGHGRLDLAALANIERAMMQGDRQIVVIDRPELLKQQFRLRAGIDEEQRRLVRLDRLDRSSAWHSCAEWPDQGMRSSAFENGDDGRARRRWRL